MNEPFVIEIIDNLPKTDDVAFDIGANYGLYTEWLASKFQKVYAFEPHPYNAKRLRYIVDRYENVEVIEKAISDKTGTIELYESANPAGHSILQEFKDQSCFTVPCITIDDFCQEKNVVPAFIKMDIEGAENVVWNGAMKTLANNVQIILEIHAGINMKRLWHFFDDLGYEATNAYGPADWFHYGSHYLLTRRFHR